MISRASLAGLSLVLSCAAAAAQELQPRLGDPLPGLTDPQLDAFETARIVFNAPLQIEDGLGPIFNDNSCGACHANPAVGGSSVKTVTRFGRAAEGGNPFDPLETLGGSLLQVSAISVGCEETIPPEANVVAQRVTPITFGAGLLELIDDADIFALAMSQPPGLNGFPHMVGTLEDPGAPPRVGRFGWKGVHSSVESFSIDASLNEMGLTSALLPNENAPNGDQTLLPFCDTVPDPEDLPGPDGMTKIDHFNLFQRFLAAPAQTPRSGMAGEVLFDAVGCGACHVTAGFVTMSSAEPALSNVTIKPYSDFLLHDMGALGDGIVQGDATETLFMTRALWGLQARESFLHDGRATGGTFADNMAMAIDEHAGEALAARNAFFALTQAEKDQLIAFLGSLGRIEFDWERDNDVDGFDWFFIEPLLTDPVPTFTPDDAAALCDVDQDGDFDLIDFGMFQRAFTGNL